MLFELSSANKSQKLYRYVEIVKTLFWLIDCATRNYVFGILYDKHDLMTVLFKCHPPHF